MTHKLTWHVEKDGQGRFVRRKADGDRFDMDLIDVVWKHCDGFKPHRLTVPATHDFRTNKTTFEEVDDGPAPACICDQVSVTHSTSDSTVAMMLDEKRALLARSLCVDP